jgi:hypothetical protein
VDTIWKESPVMIGVLTGLRAGRRVMVSALAVVLVGGLGIAGPATARPTPPSGAEAQGIREYTQTWWSQARGDNYTSANFLGDEEAGRRGYVSMGFDAMIEAEPVAGTRPLYTYWSAARGDNFAASESGSIAAAKAANYVRMPIIEGYIYRQQIPGTTPLWTFWHAGRQDNYAAASRAGIDAAYQDGYRSIRIEGYVWPCRGAAQCR